MTHGVPLARVVAGIGLLASGALTVFIGPFLFVPLGPLIVIPLILGAFELREARRLIRRGPSGSTALALGVGVVSAVWLITNEGDGPLAVPWRPLGMVVLAVCAAGLWLALRGSNRSAAARNA